METQTNIYSHLLTFFKNAYAKYRDNDSDDESLAVVSDLRYQRYISSEKYIISLELTFETLNFKTCLIKSDSKYLYLINEENLDVKWSMFLAQIIDCKPYNYSPYITVVPPHQINLNKSGLLYILMITGNSDVDSFFLSDKLRFYYSNDPDVFDNDDDSYTPSEFYYWFSNPDNQKIYSATSIAVQNLGDDLTQIYFDSTDEEALEDFLFMISEPQILLQHLNGCVPFLLEEERYDDLAQLERFKQNFQDSQN